MECGCECECEASGRVVALSSGLFCLLRGELPPAAVFRRTSIVHRSIACPPGPSPNRRFLELAAMTAVMALSALLFYIVTQPAENLWPAFVYFASSWGQTGVG